MSKMKNDYSRYEEILVSTRDRDGIEYRDKAVELLTAELESDQRRRNEFAHSHAIRVAKGFDERRAIQIEDGKLLFDESSYLILGDNERSRIKHTKNPQIVLRAIDTDAQAFARHAEAHGVKQRFLRRVVALMQEKECDMWEACEIINRGQD